MVFKISSPAAAFAKTLRSFETGGLTYSDVLAEIRDLLAAGASPTELRDILRSRELIEPLSEHAHVELLGLLNDAIAREQNAVTVTAEAQSAQSGAAADQLRDRVSAPTSISGPTLVAKSGGDAAASPGTPASPTPILPPFAGPHGPSSASVPVVSSKAEVTAAARATALAADLAAARTALESERSRTREAAKVLADRTVSVEAARARTEEALREAERFQTKARMLRDLLAARDAQIAALAPEHATMAAALEASTKSGAQLETDLQTARARATALAADLAAARTALESERRKAAESYEALTEKIKSAEATRSRTEEGLQESADHQTESRELRDALAARDAQFAALQQEHATTAAALAAHTKNGAQAQTDLLAARERVNGISSELKASREAVAARDAQFAALQQEHATMAAALEGRKTSGAQVEADLLGARARVGAISSELKATQEAAAALDAQFNHSESLLAAARKELEAVKSQSRAYLDSLRQKERREPQTDLAATDTFVERVRADSGADARRAAESQAAAAKSAPSRAQPAALTAQRQSAQTAEVAAVPAGRFARSMADKEKSEQTEKLELDMLPVPARGTAWKLGAGARVMGFGAAVFVAAVLAWFFAHRGSAPTAANSPAASSAAAQSPGTLIQDCPTCPAMTVLPAGRFKQGSPWTDGNPPSVETPQHWVSIGRPFAMSTNTVTVDEFGQFIAATGRDMQGCDTYDGTWKHQAEKNWKDPGFIQTGSHPVTCVSLQDAEAYATWLSAKTGYGYRLPSASEWEYAARAGGEDVRPWSSSGASGAGMGASVGVGAGVSTSACANANVADQHAARRYPGWQVFACDDGYVYTSPVGSFKSNSFGLNDMLGNVFQWTEDCWHADYGGAPIDGSARIDGDCAVRELRGGSWFTSPAYVRANYRNHFAAAYRTSSVGIRLVRELAR